MKPLKQITLLLLLLQITSVFAKDKFDVANDHYKNGNYQDAITLYESILNSKKHSSDLYFNLANAYYKTNQIAPAIYYYEKAKLLNPNDLEIINNLKYAQNRTIDQFETVPKMGYGAIFKHITSVFHFNTWAYIAVFLSFLMLGIYFLYDYSKNSTWKRVFFILLFIIIFLILSTVSFAFFEKYNFDKDQPAIVFEKIVDVKTEPKTNSTNVFTMHEGTKVFVLEKSNDWRKIYINPENTGWVKTKTIKILK
jgi:tetratricopeptide (TPR) repeat protein